MQVTSYICSSSKNQSIHILHSTILPDSEKKIGRIPDKYGARLKRGKKCVRTVSVFWTADDSRQWLT